jgi:glyoxylase-like metal-dependent hydrolase (beta-lactamase superfamily II)
MKCFKRALAMLAAVLPVAPVYAQFGPPASPPAHEKATPSPGVDLSGYWTPPMHEDALERLGGSELGDYAGFALNEAGRLWALSYDPDRVTLKHHQCDAYVAPYQMRAVGNFRIWEERDPHNQTLTAIHIWAQTTEGHRVIWMDGRPHPPAWAPHTFRGFSTGKWMGNALYIETSHLKQGWLRRNGTPESDQATVKEFIALHGDHLVDTTVITDPVFLTEPEIRSNDYFRQPVDHHAWLYACDDGEQIVGRAPDKVPNYLLGQQPYADEYAKRYKLPLIAGLGGAASMYPEFEAKLKAPVTEAEFRSLLKADTSKPEATSKAVDPEPHDGQIHIWHIRNDVYMLMGDGGNITVQVGDEGALVIDTGEGKLADKVIAAIATLTPRKIQFILNTSYRADRTGGNLKLGAAGADLSLPGSFFGLQSPAGATGQETDPAHHATLIAQNNVQIHMQQEKEPAAAIPADTFLEDRRRKFHNGDSMEMFWEPAAVTDSDSIVQLRRADVIATGDIFNTTQYPFIDLKNGGSVQGEINALNDILKRTVYQHEEDGGTMVVPGHGYLCNEHEVAEYRDMMVIIRDRVLDMIKKGWTLPQVKAFRPTVDYDTRYGQSSGPWTTEMFVEAVYNSLSAPKPK